MYKYQLIKQVYMYFKVIITLLILLPGSLFAENKFELIGVTELADQTMISSPEGDNYFIGVESNRIVSYIKKDDSSYFEQFYLDFGSTTYHNIIEVESVSFSNNRDYLYILLEDDNVYSIVVFNFDGEHLTLNNNLTLSSSVSLNNLKIDYIDEDEILLTYNCNNSLEIVTFNLSNKQYQHIEHNITGTYHFHSLQFSSESTAQYSILYYLKVDTDITLYVVDILEGLVVKKQLVTMSFDEYKTLRTIVTTKNSFLLYNKNDNERIIYIDPLNKEHRTLLFNFSDSEAVYVDDNRLVYINDNDLLFVDSMDLIQRTDQKFHEDIIHISDDYYIYQDEESITYKKRDIVVYKIPIEENYQYINIGPLLFTFNNLSFELSVKYLTNDREELLTHFNTDKYLDLHKYNVHNSFVSWGDIYFLDYYITLLKSDIKPELFQNFYLYSTNNRFFLGEYR